MSYDVPRGLGLIRATGEQACWWLAASLLAGNAVVVVDSPALTPAVAALLAAGLPAAVLRAVDASTVEASASTLLALAASPAVAFVASDGGPFRSLAAAIAPAAPGQQGLKALLSPLDGPQPGEPGFIRRFAWPRVIATRTLRHGANLVIEAPSAEAAS